MRTMQTLRGLIAGGAVLAGAACSNEVLTPSGSTRDPAASSADDLGSLATASIRVRCERRSGRSKISVDGNNLSPRNSSFRARVTASGGTVTSAAKRAVGDEVEFDFDSNRNDIAAGATAISATFITRRRVPMWSARSCMRRVELWRGKASTVSFARS